jgi:adenylate cyclase
VFAGLVVGVCAALIVLGFEALFAAFTDGTRQTPLQTIELKTYDWRLARTARPADARRDIVLVDIDEYSLRNLEPYVGRWPWPRQVHAAMVDYLAAAGAKVIAYDVNFAGTDSNRTYTLNGETISGDDSDRDLVRAVREAGNVILLADATYDAASGETPAIPGAAFPLRDAGILERKVVFPPYAALSAAAAGIGQNLFILDPDGPIRHTVPFVKTGAYTIPSLGVAVALRAANIPPSSVRMDRDRLIMGDRAMPVSVRRLKTEDGVLSHVWALIDFRGPALSADLKSSTYQTFSFFDLLQSAGAAAPAIDATIFRDKLVFLGTSAAGLFDAFETPFAHGRMPGINVHAAVADDILSNRFMRAAGDEVRLGTVLGLALAIGVVSTLLPAWWATGVTLILLTIVAWVGTATFAAGYWLNLTQPVLASAIALFAGVGYQYFIEGREKRKMKRLFGQYVSRDVFAQLVAHPELARLGGQRREMTVLFSDIRGFTTLTEQGQPEEVVGMLNEYFSRMVDIVFRHHGTLDKFVGDMVMALFNAPLDDPEHADHAVQAALEMIVELHTLNQQWAASGRFAGLDIGIGVNTGSMIAGNIGSDRVMSYTVIGDAVNLGARLESLNKQYGTRIIISDATRQRLIGRYACRPLGEVVVKGKTHPVAIFEVTGQSGTIDQPGTMGTPPADPIRINQTSAPVNEAPV